MAFLTRSSLKVEPEFIKDETAICADLSFDPIAGDATNDVHPLIKLSLNSEAVRSSQPQTDNLNLLLHRHKTFLVSNLNDTAFILFPIYSSSVIKTRYAAP